METVDLPKFITFDCYDTLVEFPIEETTRRMLGDRLAGVPEDEFFQEYDELRFQAILAPYRPYHEVLRQTLAEAMRRYGLSYRDEDGETLVAAVPTWGPYPDVPPALDRLRQQCKLAIISNSDDAIIAGNVRRIGVPFAHVITAEQARAYKPSPVIFDYALRVLGCESDELLHVAQGFEYDIVPGHKLGWNRVWINRYGKVGDPAYGPYQELPDLSGLPELLGL
ncbi:MAG: haloacid dehalogenase type II [Thermomicrobiales bacterium]